MDPFQTITLVVKAPNQKIDDQTIECVAGWTVRKLKNHLSEVYPNKPAEKDQKIIYSGKLLHDHLTLKDILRQYEENIAHTVHLVCSPSVNGSNTLVTDSSNGSSGSSSSSSSSSFSSHSMSNMPTSESETQLRHRNVGNAQSNTTQQQPQQSLPQQPFNPYLYNMMMQYRLLQQQQQQQQQQQPTGMPNYMMQYQQHQAVLMQQMYAQHMAQYMQYMSQSGIGQTQENAAEESVTSQNVGAPQPQAANENRANNQPANQNVRMNAGVGGPPMDDDEEEMNRDWLDYVYLFCRFGLLLSIVYFYSSIDRFLLVMGFVALMYLYQGGWFRVRRRQVRRNDQAAQAPEPAPAPAAQPQEPAQPTPPPSPSPTPQEEQPDQPPSDSPDSAAPTSETPQQEQDSGSNTDAANAEQAENTDQEPQPGVMETAWNFVSSFFTSLIPQGPTDFPN